ncbi:hypothetical protein [Ramlibacter sp.]|uniref:hypothetical protein n=1 Tax=Ramlibacter sp. TaxID=1917967 RepID=UPI003D0A2E4D
MEMPSFSYKAPRANLTRWDTVDEQTDLLFKTDLPTPLYAANERAPAAPAPSSALVGAKPRASVDAARHAVLRRLGPALKHDMVVNLQAVSMMAEMLNSRLDRSPGNGPDLQASISKLNRLAREAVLKCLNVSSWIDPGEDDTIGLSQGIADCVSLMGGSFNFRGYAIVDDVPEMDFDVCKSTLRTLFAGSLFALADSSPSPSELNVSAEVSSGFAVITITSRPTGDASERTPPETPTVPVDWADVQALAEADSAELFRGEGRIVMRLARALPSSPLRMAPI